MLTIVVASLMALFVGLTLFRVVSSSRSPNATMLVQTYEACFRNTPPTEQL